MAGFLTGIELARKVWCYLLFILRRGIFNSHYCVVLPRKNIGGASAEGVRANKLCEAANFFFAKLKKFAWRANSKKTNKRRILVLHKNKKPTPKMGSVLKNFLLS